MIRPSNGMKRERRYVDEHAEKAAAAGKACVNAWLAIPSGFSAETMAQCGWDSVTVDMQHGVQDYHSMVACFQAMDKHPVTPLVRVPWNEPGIIGKVLDGGAWGVICPMINTESRSQGAGPPMRSIRPRASAATARSAPAPMARRRPTRRPPTTRCWSSR